MLARVSTSHQSEGIRSVWSSIANIRVYRIKHTTQRFPQQSISLIKKRGTMQIYTPLRTRIRESPSNVERERERTKRRELCTISRQKIKKIWMLKRNGLRIDGRIELIAQSR